MPLKNFEQSKFQHKSLFIPNPKIQICITITDLMEINLNFI